MHLKKKVFFILSFLTIATFSLFAQTSLELDTEKIERDVFDSPSYEIETVVFEDLGFPIVIPAQNLGYQYALIWEEESDNKDKVYGPASLDQMPLFSSDCIEKKDKVACSNEALQTYLKENLNYPKQAIRKNHDGLEKLFLVIDENGKIEGSIKVISKDKPCASCAQAAVDAVANMPAWVPAKKDGKAVKSKIILPVRFDTL